MPMRSVSIASSLTSAMLTERKMFSSSFVSSAASGLETRTTFSQTSPYSASARSRARLRQAAEDLGGVAQREVRAPRVDPLGREGQVEVPPGGEAGLLEQRRDALACRAGIGGGLEHHQLVARSTSASARVESISGPRSGSRLRVSGVGTHTSTASASLNGA